MKGEGRERVGRRKGGGSADVGGREAGGTVERVLGRAFTEPAAGQRLSLWLSKCHGFSP